MNRKHSPRILFGLTLWVMLTPLSVMWQEIEVSIGIDKAMYITGEPIWIKSRFHNTTSDTFDLHPAHYELYLFNEKNERIESPVIIDWGPIEWKPTFPPGHVREYPPGDLLGGLYKGGGSNAPSHVPPGKYRAYIEGKTKGRPVRKKGEKRKIAFFKSNEVHFEVIEPEGDEKAVWELLKKAEKYTVQPNLDDEKAEEYYIEILENYPESIYIPRTLSLSASFHKFSPDPKFKRLATERYKQLVRMYPDSYQAVHIIRTMIYRYQKEGEMINEEFFHEVITNYPGTRAAKQAKKYHDEEYWKFWKD